MPESEIQMSYLDEDEYMYIDEPDNFLCDIPIGETVEVSRRAYMDKTSCFAAIEWDDENEDVGTWALFETKEEADKAAAHCKAMLEAARGRKMSNQKIKTCEYCDDGNGECVFPYYGLGPHTHKDGILGSTEFTGEIPENFSPDGDGLGVYTHCLNCGGDGTYEGVVLEPKADTEG